MNRCKVSLGILIVLILLCIISLMTVKTQAQNYLAIINKLEESLETGTTEQSLLICDELENDLENYYNITALFVNSSELREIQKIISSLQPMIVTNHEDILLEIAKLRALIQNIYHEEIPEIWHIL
ncbi:MAG: DUF4363 family protein [Ruminococcus sp.]|nr:DUF4363 family protein [Ruminococcus sp.]